jgi:4-amino-4-deoxy-L-arabinose transferase-like glycosyltransferase
MQQIAKTPGLCYDATMNQPLATQPDSLSLHQGEHVGHPTAPLPRSRLSWAWEAAILLLILLLAAALRFYRLTEVPPGLHYDEAFKGAMARGLKDGGPLPLFFASNQGEEPLATYLVAAALDLVGQEPWVIRLPSAIVGTLTVFLAWWLGRELFALARAGSFPPSGPSAAGRPTELGQQIMGLGTALVLAILYWHLSFSRIGMEPILVPFFATLTFATLTHGLNSGYAARPHYWSFALAGLALGSSLYTYKAGYFVPVVAAAFLAYAVIADRAFLRRHGRGLLLMGLVAVLVVLPIGLYFAAHPEDFLHRPTSVTVVGTTTSQSSWQALAQNLPRVLGMFFVQGDANPRSNLPGRPVLDPFLALLFVVGLGRALAGFRRPAFVLPVLWLVVMIVPTLVTEYAPHFARAIGATPAVALLCALGLWTVWQGAARLGRRWVEAAAVVLLVVGMAFSGVSTARAYFHTWAQSPDLFYAYDVGLVQVAGLINTRPAGEAVYLTPTARDHYTLQFLARRPFASFDGRAGSVLPPPGQAATVIVLLREDEVTLPSLQKWRPDGQIIWTTVDSFGRPYAAAYYLPPLASESTRVPSPDHPVDVTFANAVRLLGYSLDAETAKPGDTRYLTLYWQALSPLHQDYTAFAHLLGEHNPATNGPLWAGHDSQPDGGYYPTTAWQPGEVILDVHPIAIPADAPPGDYQLEAGLYLLATMERLPALDAAGNSLPDSAARLGMIKVEE